MDLIKIGKFIAELRKEKGLTQEQFGEQIGVTNKTVSRWETGTYMPPADALLVMSKLFDVSVNEILSGKRLSGNEYVKAAEENLTKSLKASAFTLKEKIDFYKKKWLKEHVLAMVLAGLGILGVLVAGIIDGKLWMIALAGLLGLGAHVWRYNAMMAFVEKHAYNGSGENM